MLYNCLVANDYVKSIAWSGGVEPNNTKNWTEQLQIVYDARNSYHIRAKYSAQSTIWAVEILEAKPNGT